MRTCNNIMSLFILFLLSFGLLAACKGENGIIEEPPVVEPPTIPSDFNYVYKQGTFGYEVYRIPAITKTRNNVLLAFAEARKLRSNGDSGDIDLVVKRSSDNGKTWSKHILVWDDGTNTCGNPVPMVDDKGRVHLLMNWNHGEDKWSPIVNGTGKDTRRVFYTYSDDEGLTWEQPIEITSSVKRADWYWHGAGPAHGIQIKNGSNKGRLVAPCYFTTKENGAVVDYSYVVYSDDYGKTWRYGAATSTGKVGECAIAEFSDGTLMLNMRTSEGFYRKYSLSTDGGLSWSVPKADTYQIDPGCQGSILTINDQLFLSNAAAATRTNMTVRKSADKGVSWTGRSLVYDGNSGYSDLVPISETEIAVFYEGGRVRYTDGLAFEIIEINKIK